MSVSSCGSVGGPLPVGPEPETNATDEATATGAASAEVTRGSAPHNPFAHLSEALQGALTNDHGGIVSESDARTVVNTALENARGMIASAQENLGVDADAASLLNGFERRAAAIISAAAAPSTESGIRDVILSAIRDTFTSTDTLTTGREVPTASAGDVARLPASVRESYGYYYTNVEENDWGTARIYEHEFEGQTVYAVTVTTDGDDGYIETFDAAGGPLLSGSTNYGPSSWDADFAAVRASVIY